MNIKLRDYVRSLSEDTRRDSGTEIYAPNATGEAKISGNKFPSLWDSTRLYVIGEVTISSVGNQFKAIQDNSNKDPEDIANATYWEESGGDSVGSSIGNYHPDPAGSEGDATWAVSSAAVITVASGLIGFPTELKITTTGAGTATETIDVPAQLRGESSQMIFEGYANAGTISIALYRADGTTPIGFSGTSIPASGAFKAVLNFYGCPDSTMKIVVSGTNIDLRMTNIYVGRAIEIVGPATGLWQLYPDGTYVFPSGNQAITGGLVPIGAVTTAPTKATVKIRDRAYYKPVPEGVDLELMIRHDSATGTAGGSGHYLWSLPLGLSWHSRIDFNTSATPKTGFYVGTVCSGSTEAPAFIDPYDATTFRVMVFDGTATDYLYVGSATRPMTAAPWDVTIKISIPISQLAGKGAVNLASQNSPLSLSNITATNANDSTDSNTSFAVEGSATPSVATSMKTKRVVHRVLLPTEALKFKFRHAASGSWVWASDLSYQTGGFSFGIINGSKSYDNTNHAGCGVTPVDSTHTDAVFNMFAIYGLTLGSISWATFALTYDRWKLELSSNNPNELPPYMLVIAKRTTTQALTASVTNIVFDTETTDTQGAWDGTTFLAPLDGWFKPNISEFQSTVAATIFAYVQATLVDRAIATCTAGGVPQAGARPIYMLKGQALTFRANATGTLSAGLCLDIEYKGK